MRIQFTAVCLLAAIGVLCSGSSAWAAAAGGSSTGGSSTSSNLSEISSAGTEVIDVSSISSAGSINTAADFFEGSAVGASTEELSGTAIGGNTSSNSSSSNSRMGGTSSSRSNTSYSRNNTSTRRGTSNRTGTVTNRTTARSASRTGGGSATISTVLSLGFTPTPTPAADRGESLAQHLASARKINTVTPIEVAVAGRTVTLRGEVATQYDRSLAGQLMLLEPGIDQVQNDLAVRETLEEQE